MIKKHMAPIMGVLSVVFTWWISATVGLILAIGAFITVKTEEEPILRIVAIAGGVISILMFLWFFSIGGTWSDIM